MTFKPIFRCFKFCSRTQNQRVSSNLRFILASTLLGMLTISTHAQAAVNRLNVAVSSPAKYQLDVLRVGKKSYVDRNHKFTGVPSRFAGLCFLRTADDDRNVRNGRFVSLKTNKPSAVFVGFDARMKNLPGWVKKNGWTNAGDKLTFKASYQQKFVMYRKYFPAGKIVLGGNENGYRMYVVAVKDRDGSAPKTCNINNKGTSGNTPSTRLNLKISGGLKHEIDTVQNNRRAYTDRDFTLTAVPGTYRGMCYVRPADNNNYQSNKRSLVLSTNKKVNVYVGFDARISNLPAWVNKSWKKTSGVIGLQAKYSQKMKLYRKTFPAGNIVLGGNEMGYRHYVTLVEDTQANGITSCGGGSAQPLKTTLTFSWQPSRDFVNGYRIYQANARGSAGRLVSVVRTNNANFDPARPTVQFDAWKLLGQYQGKTTCFKVSAFNSTGESKKSAPLCMKL